MEGSQRALVVEDHELVRYMIERVLGRMGFSCDCAENGHEAVELSRATPYDLIVTDLAMPVLDGFELIRRVRAGGENASAPILVVSSRGVDPDAFRIEHNVQGYLQKPFSPEELLENVATVVGRSAV